MPDPLVIRIQNPTPPRRGRRLLPWPLIALFLATITLVAVGYILYSWFIPEQIEKGEEVAELVDDVGLLMLLPVDEQPTIATVTNLDALRDQPFFEHAQIGDKVLMYPKAGRAILYSPSQNMIIEVAPIVLDAQ